MLLPTFHYWQILPRTGTTYPKGWHNLPKIWVSCATLQNILNRQLYHYEKSCRVNISNTYEEDHALCSLLFIIVDIMITWTPGRVNWKMPRLTLSSDLRLDDSWQVVYKQWIKDGRLGNARRHV